MADVTGRMRRWGVPAVPFAFSLALSLPTTSSTVFWQDSGFYLTAVREFSVLYPHGFVLYLALCKAWSFLAAPLFGFTAAVHLFSALCAAGAASFIARAARAFLKRLDLEQGADPAAIGAGCLLAAGYSFWHSALLAKTYALFYLSIAVLLWLLAVAERRRDFLLAALVLGLSWAAHPSALLLVPVVVAVLWTRRDRLRELGLKWLGVGAAIAIAAALAPTFFLPAIASQESLYDFDSPETAGAVFDYMRGKKYTHAEGSFGFDAGRICHAAAFMWEEILGVGLALLAAGVASVARRKPRSLLLFAAWIVPVVGVTFAFRAEGQADMWLVSAYLPLALLTAAGLQLLASKRMAFAAAALVAGLGWSVAANVRDLNQHGYPHAEQFARLLTKNLDRGSTLFLAFDDSIATVSWLRTVKGEATDLRMVIGARLGFPWYDRRLARTPGVRIPNWEAQYRAMPGIRMDSFELVAYANENVVAGRPLFCEREPDARFLRRDLAVVPAGMLWKIAVRPEAVPDLRYWDYPADLLAISRDVRRARGVTGTEGRPEPFENRLLLRLIHARLRLADAMLEKAPQASLDQYELIRRAAPSFLEDERFLLQWGRALFLTSRTREAEEVFTEIQTRPIAPRSRAVARYHVAEIWWSRGRREEARTLFQEALASGALDESWKKRIETRLQKP